MMSKSRIHHGMALASAATLMTLSCGALAGAAAADPKSDHTDHGKHLGQTKDHPKGPQHEHAQHQHHGHAYGHAHAPGQQADHGHGNGSGVGNGNGSGGSNGIGQQEGHNPPGNNGTVKIAGPGDAVGHPSNNPHPGCTFYVEWFGFDEGQDVVSTVAFAAQAPTSDVTIGGTSPDQVFVGGDPAGGGTDLDGRQQYTLSFSGGEPHPKQGYHVKLTVATPYSLGNDTKTKVFWVAPCEADTAAGQGVSAHHAANGGRHHANGDRGVEAATATAPDTETATSPGTSADTAAVPTSVDAGQDSSALPDWARSPWPLVAVAGGLTLAGAGLVRRNGTRA
ncbi:hypothetical protein ACVW2K_003052 [Nocardioides sp. HB32]